MKKTNYKDKRWVDLRRRILVRDKYIDRYQARFGKLRNASMVHHIFPVNEYPEYQYQEWNLISVCKSTHNMFHDRNTDELTDIGKELLRRICKKRNMPIPDKYKEDKPKEYKIKYLHWY